MSPAPRPEWVLCRSYGFEFEAHIAAAVLDAAGIPALVRGNDTAGLFGAGFQGASARGVMLLVPRQALAAAQIVLAQPRPPADELPDEDADAVAADAPDRPAAADETPHAPAGRRRDERRDLT